MQIEEKVTELLTETLLKENIKIDKVEYVKEGNLYFLRIFLDKEPYVDIDTCVMVSKLASPILDEANIIEDSYILDVCSKEKGDN